MTSDKPVPDNRGWSSRTAPTPYCFLCKQQFKDTDGSVVRAVDKNGVHQYTVLFEHRCDRDKMGTP
jgi:hypothetical protein